MLHAPALPRLVWLIAGTLALNLSLVASGLAADPPAWQETAQLCAGTTHVIPALWADKPQLKAKTTVTILDCAGPGVVTMLHASALSPDCVDFASAAAQGVTIRVFYDGEIKPSIDMPFMDFMGDIQCQSACFSTVFFAKVKESHNVRLPLPFRKHLRIELNNPSDRDLLGYTDLQYDRLTSLPDQTGYLYVDYRAGELDAQKPTTLFSLDKPAKIVAHWLQYESPKSENGETICEGDQHLFLDGDVQPTLNYLGTEDAYGFSWGFKGIQSDQRSAIIRRDALSPAGARIAVLRCRTDDAISFQQSCRWVLTFANDGSHQKKLGGSPVPYRHAVYYYARRGP